MKTIFLDCSARIPQPKTTDKFHQNAWISPTGDFYGFEGAKHEIAATWIAVFKLGGDDKTLKKGAYFNESWEGYLLKNGWLCIKNLSWLGGPNSSTFKGRNLMTERQKTRLFDYCQQFGYDYEKILAGE